MRRRDIDGSDSAWQRINDQPLTIDWYADHANAQRLEQPPRRAVARIFDGNSIARRQQDACQDIERLLCTVRDNDVVR